MEKITYGAPRLLDWVAQIEAGAATVRVHFTGGALTAYGITPAEYTTTNPFIQKVIEQSSYFKEGRITRLRRVAIADPVSPQKATKAKQQHQQRYTDEQMCKTAQTPVSAHELPITAQPTEDSARKGIAEPPAAVDESTQHAERQAEAPAGEIGNFTKVEVSCLQDAQAYLQENFKISSYKVRSYEAAQRAATEHGVLFVGARFALIDKENSDGENIESEE